MRILFLLLLSTSSFAQTAMSIYLYVNRVSIDSIGSACSYEKVIMVVDKTHFGIITAQDTLALTKLLSLKENIILAEDQLHSNKLYTVQYESSSTGILIFLVPKEGSGYSIILSSDSCAGDKPP